MKRNRKSDKRSSGTAGDSGCTEQEDKIITTLAKKQRRGGGTIREQAGYEWHSCTLVAAESNVASRFGTGPVIIGDKTIACITEVKIAGRPNPKHSGSHGQHTTAFAANREAVAAAVVGRQSEEEVRASLCSLFANLLKYPAITGACNQPAPSKELLTLLAELSDPTSKRCTECTVGDLATLYLEIRDSLPGASLDTGIGGKAGKAGRGNITGKAEGRALKFLRVCESNALGLRKQGQGVGDQLAASCGTFMLKLYDSASEASGGLEDHDKEAQRITFLLSIAQAFPALFDGPAGVQLMKCMGEKGLNISNPNEIFRLAVSFAAPLADGNATNLRPMPVPFVATCVQQPTGGKYKIGFAGRSDSTKEGSTMGDHTCSEQLMKNAATGLLLGPDGTLPTGNQLASRLEQIIADFGPENYAMFDSKMGTAQIYELSEEQILEMPLLGCQERFNALGEHVADLKVFITKLKPLGDDACTVDLVGEAAEKYMTLVDDRPTAVNFSGPASGHGEPKALAELGEQEAADTIGVDAPTLLQTALGLLDCTAVYESALLCKSTDKGDLYEVVLARIIAEFQYFLNNAYPKVYKAILDGFPEDALAGALKERVTDLATLERQTLEEKKMQAQIGDDFDTSEANDLDKRAALGEFGRRSSGRKITRPKFFEEIGEKSDDEESEDNNKNDC